MDTNQAAAIIRKAMQESNKHFLLTYLDKNGYPHSNYMGFAHLNRNMTVIMMLRSTSSRIAILKEQPWIELVFHTGEYGNIVKFFGKVVITSSAAAVEKLLTAYPFLAGYFKRDGSDSVLVQLQTQMIELEHLPTGALWHEGFQYLVKDGVLVPTEDADIQGASVGFVEQDESGFDDIRRMITRNHGEILMSVINEEFDTLDDYISVSYSGPENTDKEHYKERMSRLYSGLNLGKSEINWGLRDFEIHKNGTVTCGYFLDITTPGGKEITYRSKELWVQEDSNWVLMKEEVV